MDGVSGLRERLADAGYVAEAGLASALELLEVLGRPLLVEGDAGVGKTEIAKALARAGLCSRREAERWIGEGRVAVNGTVLTTPAVLVTEADSVTVDGRPLPGKEPTRLWRYNKPAGLVTTQRDPQGRPTVFERLPPALPRVVSIGRLDLNSEGLLLLTNDGALARFLELPSTGWPRQSSIESGPPSIDWKVPVTGSALADEAPTRREAIRCFMPLLRAAAASGGGARGGY